MTTKKFPLLMAWGLLAVTLALFCLLAAPAGAAPTATLTVCPAGPPDCDYAVIQDAVDAANDGDVIKISAANYSDLHNHPAPPGYPNPPAGGIDQIIYIDKTITIQGGYAAPGFVDPPDPEANPTLLDAHGQGRGIVVAGSVSPRIEGLSIANGDATGLWGGHSWDGGGGIYVITATATITNSHLYSNTATVGAGIYLYQSDSEIVASNIVSNTANFGGGVYLYLSDALVTGNVIEGNTVLWYGGGLLANFGNIVVNGNTFGQNHANSTGGGLFVSGSNAILGQNTIVSNTVTRQGGGLHLENGSSVTLVANTILGNSALGDPDGPGYGGGLSLDQSSASLNRNTFLANAANGGGGLYLNLGDLSLDGNTVRGNTAEVHLYGGGGGGGLLMDDSQVTLTHNHFVSNVAVQGGGLWIAAYSSATMVNNTIVDNDATDKASGLYVSQSNANLSHTTLARNAGGGSGIYVASGGVVLTNTILVSHTVGLYLESGTTAVLEATLWANGTDWAGDGTVQVGTVNLWDDPAFVDPDAGDYHLSLGSAALDAGVDAGILSDIDYQPRPYLAPDLGADEYWPPGVLHALYLPLLLRNH